MRGAALAAIVLTAALAGPALASAAPQPSEQRPPTAAVDGAALAARSPTVARTDASGTSQSAGGGPEAVSDPVDGPPTSASVDRVENLDPDGAAPVTVAHELSLTPERPGELRVEVRLHRRASLANATQDVTLALSDRATVVAASGFERAGDRYRLDAGDGAGTITYRLRVNRTAGGDEYEAVDAGPWALVRTPTPSVAAHGLPVERRYSVDGPGVVDDGLAYLGPHRTYNRTVQGQRLSLVVPAAAELRPSPMSVMNALSTAAREFDADDGATSALFVAAPTTVDWAHAAQQVGDSDAWVQADQPLYHPRNAWLHEYVHTRQSFRTTRETRWLVEGTATYYAALLSLRQGLVDFAEFRRHLLAGMAPRNSQAVLADPATWRGGNAEYRKGALVVGELDRQLRRSSRGGRSFEWVFGRLNRHDGRVRLSTLTSLLAGAGGKRLQTTAHRYATEPRGPTTWSAEDHRQAFGWAPPQVSADLAAIHATGPGGARSLGTSPEEVVLLTGERLVARLTVVNAGDRRATVVAPLDVNFTAVERTVGIVSARGLATATVSHRFSNPGGYYVVVGGDAIHVRVVEPARSVQVTDVDVAADDHRYGTITVVTRVHNRQERPARLSLPVTVDGHVVATRTIAVGANDARRVEATVQLERPGRHEVAIAGEGAALNVSDAGEVVTATRTGASDTETGLLSMPGARRAYGVAALAAAVLAAVALASRRR